MSYESFAEKIKFRSGEFDKELFKRIVEYIIEKELVTPKSIEVYRSGVEVKIRAIAEMMLVDEFDLDIVQAVDYLSIASFVISMTILSKIEGGNEPSDELEKYIIEKLYTPQIKEMFLTRKFMTNPILEEFEVIKFVKDTPEGPLESYGGVRILIDKSGDRDFDEVFLETTKGTLQEIVNYISEVISDDARKNSEKE
ncbi:hypothetical protein [Thermococcus sp. JCM 11816]|uniref:hypothetical protein n=1 Tax=Thermococcus sp. (strain JCM 11816 / KS-1) TaxID=1295125 RepID=UPI0006D108DF